MTDYAVATVVGSSAGSPGGSAYVSKTAASNPTSFYVETVVQFDATSLATIEAEDATSGFFFGVFGAFSDLIGGMTIQSDGVGGVQWRFQSAYGVGNVLVTTNHLESGQDHTLQLKVDGSGAQVLIDGDDYGIVNASVTGIALVVIRAGQYSAWSDGQYAVKYVKVGTTSFGSTDVFDGEFPGDFSLWTSTTQDGDSTIVVGSPTPPTPVLAPCQSPFWRFIVTDLDSNTITILDRVASDRQIYPVLDAPNWLSFSVPSDNPLVNLPYDPSPSFDPYVAEGDRLVYAFRQESYVTPYFTCRAAGIIMQVEDAAQQDDARTKVTAWDPWKLLAYRPAQDTDGLLPSQIDPLPTGYWDGVYPPGTTGATIVLDQLLNTIVNDAPCRIDAGAAYGGTGFYDGTLEATAALTDGFTVQQGMSVADVWNAMVNTFTLDIVLTPIFDPVNRPGYTHQLNIYVEAGVDQPDDIFGWNRPPHSLVGLNRMIDGTQRANKVFLAAGQGGTAGKMASPATDATSVTKYGPYWAQQYLPGSLILDAVEDMAAFQLALRKNGRTTVQFDPAPERSPCPFIEYNLGDRVPVYAAADGFRQELAGYVRIYGFPISLSDDALETVTGMILLPESA